MEPMGSYDFAGTITNRIVTDSISNYTDLLNDTELFIGGRMTGEFQTQSGT